MNKEVTPGELLDATKRLLAALTELLAALQADAPIARLPDACTAQSLALAKPERAKAVG